MTLYGHTLYQQLRYDSCQNLCNKTKDIRKFVLFKFTVIMTFFFVYELFSLFSFPRKIGAIASEEAVPMIRGVSGFVESPSFQSSIKGPALGIPSFLKLDKPPAGIAPYRYLPSLLFKGSLLLGHCDAISRCPDIAILVCMVLAEEPKYLPFHSRQTPPVKLAGQLAKASLQAIYNLKRILNCIAYLKLYSRQMQHGYSFIGMTICTKDDGNT